MSEIFDFEWYAKHALKIKTKIDGIIPFTLRAYQKEYIQHLKDAFPTGIIRSIVLKPRQSGFSTIIAGINTHAMCTRYNEVGVMLADKHGRTNDVHNIYMTYINNLPRQLLPMIDRINGEEIFFDNPDKMKRATHSGLGSGFKSETANDPFAGRAGTRKWAHLTEFAFYRYPDSVDEGIQNSIPLAKGTRVFKESTAFGVSGTGAAFYNLWRAAEAGESIYKPFFVAWYQIDDYQLPVPRGFILTPTEIDLIKRCPLITNANLVWRRLKLTEYAVGTESPHSPEERFAADFPSYAEQAFLSTGRPVFDQEKIKAHVVSMKNNPPPLIKIHITQPNLSMYPQMLKVFQAPQKNKKYVLGIDVAEGLVHGDYSSVSIIDEDFKQVSVFHGHVPPDILGKIVVELAKTYNKALVTLEINNMGISTLQAIKDMGYLNLYQREVVDEIDKSKVMLKLGWRTTSSNKQKMLNTLIAKYRESEVEILDIDLLREMMDLSREDDGGVNLNGKDRIVAICLALVGHDQLAEPASVFNPNKKEKLFYETKDISKDYVLKKDKK